MWTEAEKGVCILVSKSMNSQLSGFLLTCMLPVKSQRDLGSRILELFKGSGCLAYRHEGEIEKDRLSDRQIDI